MNKWLVNCLIGGFVVGGLTFWLAPQSLGWYFEPPVDIGINCRPAVEWSLDKFRWFLVFGFFGGVALGLAASIFISKKKSP